MRCFRGITVRDILWEIAIVRIATNIRLCPFPHVFSPSTATSFAPLTCHQRQTRCQGQTGGLPLRRRLQLLSRRSRPFSPTLTAGHAPQRMQADWRWVRRLRSTDRSEAGSHKGNQMATARYCMERTLTADPLTTRNLAYARRLHDVSPTHLRQEQDLAVSI